MNIQKSFKVAIIALVFTSFITSCNQPEKKEEINIVNTEKMELKENKALAADFIEAMRASNVDKLKTMITDDFSWWILGKPEYLGTAGEHDAEFFLAFFQSSEFFPEGVDFKPIAMIAEDNKVAAEAELKAKTALGTNYENSYHFLFIFENGKIKRMKEYMDTHHAKTTFGL